MLLIIHVILLKIISYIKYIEIYNYFIKLCMFYHTPLPHSEETFNMLLDVKIKSNPLIYASTVVMIFLRKNCYSQVYSFFSLKSYPFFSPNLSKTSCISILKPPQALESLYSLLKPTSFSIWTTHVDIWHTHIKETK